jgi:hypothetical protein
LPQHFKVFCRSPLRVVPLLGNLLCWGLSKVWWVGHRWEQLSDTSEIAG